MSYRELWVLISKLPQESWTQTALRDEPVEDLELPESSEEKFGPWALADFQRVTLIDAINRLAAVTAWSNGNSKFPPPEPLPRPGRRVVKREPQLSPAALDYLNSLRATG
jgi:hypothetical protein